MTIKKNNVKGFTLVELLLSMGIFSLVMTVATVGFVNIHRSFNRGLVKKELSEAAQLIRGEISNDIRSVGSDVVIKNCDELHAESGCPSGVSAVCMAQSRYTWSVNNSNYQFQKSLDGCADASSTEAKKLLASRYKILSLEVDSLPSNPQLFRISGVISVGDMNVLNYNSSKPEDTVCKGSAEIGAASCAVEKFNFIVYARGGSSDE